MEPYCQNPYCQNESVKEVPVSVNKPGDQARAVCATCEEVYKWGVQHGRAALSRRRLWGLAIADRGIVVHAKAFSTKKKAEKALAEYLRQNEGYDGPDGIPQICDWLAEHNERLSADIYSTAIDST